VFSVAAPNHAAVSATVAVPYPSSDKKTALISRGEMRDKTRAIV
jgi:hypothetical protein